MWGPGWRPARALSSLPALFPLLFLGNRPSPVAVRGFPVVPSVRVVFGWRQSHPEVGSPLSASVWNQAVHPLDETPAGPPCPRLCLPHCFSLNLFVPMVSAAIPLPPQFLPAAAAQPCPHLTPCTPPVRHPHSNVPVPARALPSSDQPHLLQSRLPF